MAYQQNNYKKPYSKQQNNVPKNEVLTFTVQVTGTSANGRDYDVQSMYNLISDLSAAGTFTKLSVPVQISRAVLENNEEMRGNTVIGFVKAIDNSIDGMTMDVTVYGRVVDKIKSIDGLIMGIRAIIDREGNASTILGFDLTKG